jgi:hypothetical protein
MSEGLGDLWRRYLPSGLPDSAFSDLGQTMAYPAEREAPD